MAKGDDSRSRNQINFQGGQAQNRLNNLWDTVTPQNQFFWNNYQNAANSAMPDYQNIMNSFKAMEPGYAEFARTGGFSPTDVASMRSHAIAPTAAVYKNAMRDVDRAKALSGGYAPNYIAARSRINRDLAQSISDTSTGVESNLAQMKQQGRLAGMEGGSNLARSMAGLYGTAPGLASTFGQQLLGSTGNLLNLGGLQNQLGLGLTNAQIQASQLPGKGDYALSRIGQIANMGAGLIGGGGFNLMGQNRPLGADQVFNGGLAG